MASLSSSPLRSLPLQERSSRRIARFLEVAEAILAEVGYDALTMTAVADRAGSSIGALYRWFPDKASLAQALHREYASAMTAHWESLIHAAGSMTVAEFAGELVERTVEFARDRPGYLPLRAAPLRFERSSADRKSLRDEFVSAFRAYAPGLSPERGLLTVNVALQLVNGLIALFGQAPEEEREGLTREFKRALTLYLSEALAAS